MRTRIGGLAFVAMVALALPGCPQKPDFEGSKVTSALLPKPVGQLEEWRGTERSGRVFDTAELRGKFAVVDFVFTRCGGPCPQMQSAMAELQKALGEDNDDTWLVSFTVDPEYDTPEILTDYANRYGAGEDWLFLRYSKAHLKTITDEELKIGSGDDPIMHSSKFVLLDKQGRVRAYYDPIIDVSWLPTLLSDLDILRGGKGTGGGDG